MRLISFDIGIKNMAYCCFDISGSITIIDWAVINLMDEEVEKPTCTCSLKPKNKTAPPTICGRIAKYRKGEDAYCEKHAKMNDTYKIRTAQCSQKEIKKMKIDALRELCTKQGIELTIEKKPEIVDLVEAHFSRTCFDRVVASKKVGAGETDLVTVGRNMKAKFDEIENMHPVDIVVIENQISPIANRMKTIQGMLAQYFIMREDDVRIDFVSSANKLKDFKPLDNTLIKEGETGYKKNKKNGVEYCSQILAENSSFNTWSHVLQTKKKDDLADCFLQGIWYIQNKLKKSL